MASAYSPITAAHEWFTNKNRTLEWTIADAAGDGVDISGWTFSFGLFDYPASSGTLVAKFTKTPAISNAANGVVQASIDPDDTAALVGADIPLYWYELKRTDSGAVGVVAYGPVVLRQSAT